MIAVNQDAFTRIDILQRLVRALEIYSRFWTYRISVSSDLEKLKGCARTFSRRSPSVTIEEFQARIEEVYIEMLTNGYRYKKKSCNGSIYFEHPDGHVIRVSDHKTGDWVGDDFSRATIRIDGENWFQEVDGRIERLVRA